MGIASPDNWKDESFKAPREQHCPADEQQLAWRHIGRATTCIQPPRAVPLEITDVTAERVELPPAVYKKWRPSGRNCGLMWPPSDPDTRVTSFASPPEAEIRNRGPTIVGANRITPLAFHVPPPLAPPTSARACTEPVSISIRFSLPSAKNPIDRPSADQNGSRSPDPSGTREARGRSCR